MSESHWMPSAKTSMKLNCGMSERSSPVSYRWMTCCLYNTAPCKPVTTQYCLCSNTGVSNCSSSTDCLLIPIFLVTSFPFLLIKGTYWCSRMCHHCRKLPWRVLSAYSWVWRKQKRLFFDLRWVAMMFSAMQYRYELFRRKTPFYFY